MTQRGEEPASEDVAQIARVYERYATSTRRRRAWSADNPGNRAIRAELVSELLHAAGPALNAGPILDIGCGSGWWLRTLADRGVTPQRLHGVDILESRVQAACRALPGADVRWADARSLPYEDGGFAVVTMLLTLSSLPVHEAVERAAAEAARVLAPGGRLIVYEPRYRNPFNRHTLLVRPQQLRGVMGAPVATATLTVAPPVVRRLGRGGTRLYPVLAAFPLVRTHTLRTFAGSTAT